MAPSDNRIYSATYSNVPVYEFNVEGEHVMRRRADDWINATHILKVAKMDKPARTRILEREVQKNVHEKVQGGYGKYQGTWVPLQDGRILAERQKVYEIMRPIFDYVPGDRSPPQAPKHTTAASNKPRLPKSTAVRKASRPKPVALPRRMSFENYDNLSNQHHDDESLENSTMVSESIMDEDDVHERPQFGEVSRSRKRKRAPEVEDFVEQQHMMYADELLDYFMLSSSDTPLKITPPMPPEKFQPDRYIDDQKHTALHWASAMGDIDIVRDLICRGADPLARNVRGETPLIRAILFTNNHEKNTMPKLLNHLTNTIKHCDSYGGTIFHHAAWTTSSHSKAKCARYYCEVLLNKLSETNNTQDLLKFLNAQDGKGDTALHIFARNRARKCVKTLQGRGVQGDIPNRVGQTADQLLQRLHSQRTEPFSSSPIQPDLQANGLHGIQHDEDHPGSRHAYRSQAARSLHDSLTPTIAEKGAQLAQTMELEAQERTQDLEEASCALETVAKELEQIRQQRLSLLAEEGSDEAIPQSHIDEVENLFRENESIQEQQQRNALHARVCEEESKVSPGLTYSINLSEAIALRDRIEAATALASQQAIRRNLVVELVQAMALAGMSETGKLLGELISKTAGVHADQLDELAPEIEEQLEMDNMDDGPIGERVQMIT